MRCVAPCPNPGRPTFVGPAVLYSVAAPMCWGMLGSMAKNRRQFLIETALTGSALALPLGSAVRAQQADAVRLSDGMLALLGPDANVLVADSADGLVMIDGGSASRSASLLATVAEHFGAKPVGALFNTHWHPEQTGSNLTLGERGAEIIAHENTRLWLSKDIWVRWSDRKYDALPAAARPSTTFLDAGNMQFGARRLEYAYLLNAHTDGDVCVLFPDENVLVTGGVVSNQGWPVIDWWTGGWIGGLLDGFDGLLELANEQTRILPANGPIMTLAELEAQREMYLTVFDRLHGMLRGAYSLDEILAAAPTAEFDADFGDPAQFLELAYQSMLGHLRDAYSERMRNIP